MRMRGWALGLAGMVAVLAAGCSRDPYEKDLAVRPRTCPPGVANCPDDDPYAVTRRDANKRQPSNRQPKRAPRDPYATPPQGGRTVTNSGFQGEEVVWEDTWGNSSGNYQGSFGESYSGGSYRPGEPGYVSDPYPSTSGGGWGNASSGGWTDPAPYTPPATQQWPSYESDPLPPYTPPAPPVAYTPIADTPASTSFTEAVQMMKAASTPDDFRRAKPYLENLTRAEPTNAAAWRWLGECHYNLMEFQQALTAFEHATNLRPNAADGYYIQRGEGFAHLHYGHQLWKQMDQERASGQLELASETFSRAHDHYKKALEILSFCLNRAPDDGEAIYGRAMAAEGASRKLYSNAVSHLNYPESRERANLFAANCIEVMNVGLESARLRAADPKFQGETGPLALMGGLYKRKATLYQKLEKIDLALLELESAISSQRAILDIDKHNANAQKELQDCEKYRMQWTSQAAAPNSFSGF